MNTENETIGIDKQIETVTELLPIMDKASQPVMDAVLQTLQFAKAYAEKSVESMLQTILILGEEQLDHSKLTAQAIMITQDLEQPKWFADRLQKAQDDFAVLEPQKFALAKERAISLESEGVNETAIHDEVVEQTVESDENILKALKQGKQYVMKSTLFRSGVRRPAIAVLCMETYPRWKKIRFKSIDERDAELAEMLKCKTNLEYEIQPVR